MASIMVSAVAFVVTYEQPPPATYDERATLSTMARDALDILYDMPVESGFGGDALSAYIAACLNEQCDDLEESLAKLVPPGASYALYLSNGYDTYPVIVQGVPAGEAVSSSKTFEPRWSSTFLATATESIGTDDALLVYALPIFHSTPVAPGGSQLLVKVSGLRADGSRYALLASAATLARDAAEPEASAAAIYFVDASGNALPVHNLSGTEDTPQRITLRLEESQPDAGNVPAGAEVTVHMPRGWTASAPAGENPLWTIEENADDPNGAYVGSAVRATLVDTLDDSHADLLLDVTYHGDVLDYYPIVATLSRGATGVASMLVRGEVHEHEPALATPSLYLSVPSPMGSTATTTWTLSAHIPVNDSGLPGELSAVVHIDTIEIMEQEGNVIFGDVDATAAEAMGGTWVNGGDSLVWTGDVEMDLHKALNLTFHVQASGTAGPTESRAQFVPPVTFDDGTSRLVGRTGWGFYRQAMLPETAEYAGYNTDTGVLSEEHDLTTDGVYRQTELPGAISYTTSTVSAVQDSLYGSYVTASRRTVPVGENVIINADVQSLLFSLTEAGQRAGVTLRFYPPWSGDERVPIYEQENLDQGLLSGEVSQMVTLDLNGDGYADPVIGTTNGRVIAYHALTGQRLQGNTFTAPITSAAQQQQAVPLITAMATIRIAGEDYIVVGTDTNSDGLFVLDRDFDVRWSYAIGAGDTLAIDTSADMDDDGNNEIVVARAYEVGTARNALVYAFEAPLDPALETLVPIPGDPPPVQDQYALYYSLGTPTTILAQEDVGPWGSTEGVLVPIQTLFDPGLEVNTAAFPPEVTEGAASTPRAGVQGMNELGESTSTLFGAPASVLRTIDHNGDDIDDVVLGGASGYVIAANGRALTQPLYSYIMSPTTQFISAHTRSSSESYTLTSEGQVLWTDDAWTTSFGPTGLALGGNAIGSDAYNSYWVVGDNNAIWRSYDPGLPLPDDPTMLHYPAARELESVVPTMTRAGAPWLFGLNIYDFHDIVWVDDQEAIVVGSACALSAICTEPIALRTKDGGNEWAVLSRDSDNLFDHEENELAQSLDRVRVMSDGTGWMVGERGLVVRSDATRDVWRQLPMDYVGALVSESDLNDIACKPSDPDVCIVVGDNGVVFETSDASAEFPIWDEIEPGTIGLPADRDLYGVGFAEDDRAYIASHNMVLGRFHESNWTALPLNYFENDAFVVSTLGDGTGFVYGGTPATGRIWFLHDYATESQAITEVLTPELAGKPIRSVQLIDGNVTFAQQEIVVSAATTGDNWKTLGTLAAASGPVADARLPVDSATAAFTDPTDGGSDLRIRIAFNTSGDKTILTPSVRELTFSVGYQDIPAGPIVTTEVTLDFETTADLDADLTTASWDTASGSVHQAFIDEFWTRNVTGGVHDLQTGFDVLGAGAYDELWVATGDVIAENSPDYAIYAGTDLEQVMEHHDRVYLLDGQNGHPAAISEKLEGEVRQIRLVDQDPLDDVPELLFAATWDTSALDAGGELYALDPVTLDILWSVDLGEEMTSDMEVGELAGPDRAVFLGAMRETSDVTIVPHLWAISEAEEADTWAVIPDDMGSYHITKEVEPGWLFGPYVVEIEVEWEDTASQVDASGTMAWPSGAPAPPGTPPGTTVLRSARFYDHFMVTPHDVVSPPNPVYTARLLMWLQDWG